MNPSQPNFIPKLESIHRTTFYPEFNIFLLNRAPVYQRRMYVFMLQRHVAQFPGFMKATGEINHDRTKMCVKIYG